MAESDSGWWSVQNLPTHGRQQAVIAPRLVLPGRVVENHAVIVADGRITGIVPVNELPEGISTRRSPRGVLAPGFVDIHGHGAQGRSANEGTESAMLAVAGTMLQAGVTTWLPTFASAPVDDLTAGLQALRSVQNSDDVARMPGAHLEGPYFSQAQRGAQTAESLRTPDDGSVEELLEHADVIRIMSFAPELAGAIALTRRLVSAGIIAAAGHSDGDASHLYAAQDAGLSHVIHVYSGQSTTRRQGAWRVPGMLEATLASDHVTVEMIADGKHLPVELMRIALRALGGRLCVVSDATPGAGQPDGSSYGMGATQYIVEDGVGMTLDRTSFGGSTTLLPTMLPLITSSLGLDLATAMAMASEIPARAAGLTDVGQIGVGYHADFTLLSEQLEVVDAAVGGRWNSEFPH